MKGFFVLFKHVMKLTFKKKGNWITFLLLPLLGVFAALAFNNDSTDSTKIGLVDQNNSYLSQDIINELNENSSYEVIALENKNYESVLKNRNVDCVIMIPNDFDQQIINNTFDKIDIYSINDETSTLWIQSFLNYYIDNIVSISKVSDSAEAFKVMYDGFKAQPYKLVKENVGDTTQNKGVTKSSIGFLLVFMLMASRAVTNFIINDKRTKTYTRIFSSPITKSQYIWANIITNFFVFIIQLIVILLLSLLVFKLNFYISTIDLIILFLSFGFVAMGFGIIIAVFSNSTNQATQLSNILIVPTCMLSGCFWPLELMPSYLQKFALIFPQTWVLRSVDTLQRGNTISSVLPNIAIILGYGFILIIISLLKINNEDDIKNVIA